MDTANLESYTNYPTTMEEVESVLRTGKARSEAERRFVGRVQSWTEKGCRVKLEKQWNAWNGWQFTASLFVADNLGASTAYLSWTLVLPHTATKQSSIRRLAACRFHGSCASEAKCRDERLCAISAANILEGNARFPRPDRHLDGMGL